jgi:protocatechuate 3,4-dioxygenase beta subunit
LIEDTVKQLREIEEKAQELYESTVHEAKMLPITAEEDARALQTQLYQETEAEAKRILAEAQDDSDNQKLLQQAEEDAARKENLAMNHFDRAVNYILHRVVGRQ